MSYFAIPNLRSDVATPFDPTTWVAMYPPIQTKSAFRQWCQSPDTKHAFISGVEPVSPHQRVDGENPPNRVHALILDFDTPADMAVLADNLKKRLAGAPMPTWATLTWSGNLRLIWELEKPVPVDENTAGPLLEHLAKLVKAPKLHPGFDKTSTNPSQYFEAGSGWVHFGGLISHSDVVTCMYKVGAGKQAVSEVTVPLEDIKSELDRRFPGRWKNDFTEGARGPLFWIDDGIEREGAVVTLDGMVCFSDRAGSPFISWREIFGAKFVDEFETRKISSGVKDIYFDGREFWPIALGSRPQSHSRENIILYLKSLGFRPDKKKGQIMSELESALLYITTHNRVDGAAPYIFRPERVTEDQGKIFINISHSAAVKPAADGDPKNWPWIYDYFHNLFDPVCDEVGCMPLDFWYAWLSRAYEAAHYKTELSGHAVIIVGAPGRGKTLLSQFILGGLLGGAADASEYLAGKTTFNEALSNSAVWAVDDTVSASNHAEFRKFTEMVKKTVANPRIKAEKKYKDQIDVPWFGRLIITLNEDANSLSMIPNLESSNRDKLMAFKVSEYAKTQFLDNTLQQSVIKRELPHLAKWLLDYQINPAVLGPARFGIRSYFHPLVENSARDSSTRQVTTELLDIFLKYYADANPGETVWTGNTTELIVAINRIDELRTLPIVKDAIRLQRDLSSAEEYSKANPHQRKITSQPTGRGKVWTIELGAGVQ